VHNVRDDDKTKQQLIDELVELRRRVADLEASEAERRQVEGARPLKIGEILIEMGYLTTSQLERSLRMQKQADTLGHKHKPLGQIMVESGVITREQLQIGLAEQLTRLRRRFL
jgi:hypothetical protein